MNLRTVGINSIAGSPATLGGKKMKNEYEAAEAVEIGKAGALVLGEKQNVPDLDSCGVEPMDRHCRVDD